MIKIRRGVFETNSSSTHSICISKKPVKINTENIIGFEFGEFGWEEDCIDIKDYLYTAIMSFDDSEELLAKLKYILDKNNIKYYFGRSKDGYIDHYSETREFVDTVLNNEDMLMRLLFGDSCVYTGNDNSDADYEGKNIADAVIRNYVGGEWVATPNPFHDENNYDYFYKGN